MIILRIIEVTIGVAFLIVGLKPTKRYDLEDPQDPTNQPIEMGQEKYDNDSRKAMEGLAGKQLMRMFPIWTHKVFQVLLGFLFMYMGIFR